MLKPTPAQLLGYGSLQEATMDKRYTRDEMRQLLNMAIEERLEYLWNHKHEGDLVHECPHCYVSMNYPWWQRRDYGCPNCSLGLEIG